MNTGHLLIAVVFAVTATGRGLAADQSIPAKIGVVKPAKLAKFVAKNPAGFALPSGAGEDPSLIGAQLAFFDTGTFGGSFVHTLPAAGWKGLGNPAGSKGYKYSGKRAGDSTCTVVLIKDKVIKGVCKGSAVTLSTPFAGNAGIILGISTVLGGTLRYCAELGGTLKKNDTNGFKRKDAPPPAMCPAFPPPTPTGTPAGTATATGTPAGTAAATATPTVTPPGGCPVAAGRYTFTTTGGSLRVATFAPFAFPAGGQTIQDVGPGDGSCLHDTVVPFPGGLTVPVFCVPALGASVKVTQSGCGVGRLDSNGGSDFTISEIGDTSESPVCGVPQVLCPASGPAPDSSGRLDVTVGDGTTDTCPGGGTANAILTIPVNTLTWVAADSSCPDDDGTYNAGSDTKLAEFPQTLDLTTDTNTARFSDLDSNGCSRSGLGPAGPFASTGKCLDLGTNTVNIAASGTVFSSGGPTYDLLFTTVQNNTMSAPAPLGGATCPSPPAINFGGTVSRCIVAP